MVPLSGENTYKQMLLNALRDYTNINTNTLTIFPFAGADTWANCVEGVGDGEDSGKDQQHLLHLVAHLARVQFSIFS